MNEIQAYIDRFIREIGQPDVTPHALMFDRQGKFAGVRFTTAQLRACIEGYLDTIEPVMAALAEEKDRVAALNAMHHDDASELLLAYIYRTGRDDGYADMVQAIRDWDAPGQIGRLLALFDERDQRYDVVQRMASIQAILADLAKPTE